MLLASFLETADRLPSKLAIQDTSRKVTFRDLVTLSSAMRRLIASETDRPHVGVLLPTTAAFAGSFYGGLWAGKTIIPLNFLLQLEELEAVVADSGIDLIITCNYFEHLVKDLPIRSVFLERAGLKRRFLMSRLKARPTVPEVKPDDLAVILYTSGTTGLPRGVCLTHNNLYSNTLVCIEHTRMSPKQHFFGVLPLFHAFGLTAMFIAPTLLGATAYYSPRFQVTQVIEALTEHKISVLMATPSMYAALAHSKSVSKEAFASVELAISGGEPLPMAVYEQYRDRFSVEICEGYGLTETSPVISANLPWANKPGTVGTPLPGVEVQVRDAQDEALPPGEIGEICVHGPSVMRGYYNKPDETAAVLLPDGWLRTGDLGFLDADGFITITGRVKDLIIVGGENVFPREIESVLDQHPGVAESSVIGVPDANRGEVVVGFVVPKDGVKLTAIELRDHCRHHLAGYKVPRKIIIDGDLPRGPTGKVLKRALRLRMPQLQAIA